MSTECGLRLWPPPPRRPSRGWRCGSEPAGRRGRPTTAPGPGASGVDEKLTLAVYYSPQLADPSAVAPTRRPIGRGPSTAVTALVCAPICPVPRNVEFPVDVPHVCYEHNEDEGRTDGRSLKAESYLGGTQTHNSIQRGRYRGSHNTVFKHHSVMRYSAAPTLAGRRGVAGTGSNRDGARRQQHSRGPPPRRKQNHNHYSLMVGFCCSAVNGSTHCRHSLGNMADRDGILFVRDTGVGRVL